MLVWAIFNTSLENTTHYSTTAGVVINDIYASGDMKKKKKLRKKNGKMKKQLLFQNIKKKKK